MAERNPGFVSGHFQIPLEGGQVVDLNIVWAQATQATQHTLEPYRVIDTPQVIRPKMKYKTAADRALKQPNYDAYKLLPVDTIITAPISQAINRMVGRVGARSIAEIATLSDVQIRHISSEGKLTRQLVMSLREKAQQVLAAQQEQQV